MRTMRTMAIVITMLCLVLLGGCNHDKLPMSKTTELLIIATVENYVGNNLDDFQKAMEVRGHKGLPNTLPGWKAFAEDFYFCAEWIARHGGPPPLPPVPTPVEVRSMGVERSVKDAFGGVGH